MSLDTKINFNVSDDNLLKQINQLLINNPKNPDINRIRYSVNSKIIISFSKILYKNYLTKIIPQEFLSDVFSSDSNKFRRKDFLGFDYYRSKNITNNDITILNEYIDKFFKFNFNSDLGIIKTSDELLNATFRFLFQTDENSQLEHRTSDYNNVIQKEFYSVKADNISLIISCYLFLTKQITLITRHLEANNNSNLSNDKMIKCLQAIRKIDFEKLTKCKQSHDKVSKFTKELLLDCYKIIGVNVNKKEINIHKTAKPVFDNYNTDKDINFYYTNILLIYEFYRFNVIHYYNMYDYNEDYLLNAFCNYLEINADSFRAFIFRNENSDKRLPDNAHNKLRSCGFPYSVFQNIGTGSLSISYNVCQLVNSLVNSNANGTITAEELENFRNKLYFTLTTIQEPQNTMLFLGSSILAEKIHTSNN